jgi:alkylation response protein AidB-like acyl-CoA dehydrogenase
MELMSEEERGDLVQRCRDLARTFAARAAACDRDGRFPAENFRDLKDSGLLGIMVPKEHGGLGSDFLTYTLALEQLAIGDASTGLTFNMHNILMGSLAEMDVRGLRGSRGQVLMDSRAWIFEQAVKEQKVFASATSEPGIGAHVTKVKTTYRRVDDGFVVDGVKSFVSMAGHADYYVVAARSERSTDERLDLSYILVERDNPGVRVEEVWDVLGMRATASNTVHLTNCFVPKDRLLLGIEGTVLHKITREPHWLVGGYNGVYLGICSATFEFMTDYLRKQKIPGTERSLASDPVVQHRVGELYVQLEAARAVTYEAARLVAQAPGSHEANVAIHRAKFMVGELGPELASQAIRICGGSTIAKRLPLERYYRDARCGGLMPAKSDECLSYVGKAALGVDLTKTAELYW